MGKKFTIFLESSDRIVIITDDEDDRAFEELSGKLLPIFSGDDKVLELSSGDDYFISRGSRINGIFIKNVKNKNGSNIKKNFKLEVHDVEPDKEEIVEEFEGDDDDIIEELSIEEDEVVEMDLGENIDKNSNNYKEFSNMSEALLKAELINKNLGG